MRHWDDIRFFLSVAETGSTSAAAKALGVAQTTVSRRIDALEAELGLTLFRREARGFRLTRDGARLRDLAEPLGTAFAWFQTDLDALTRPANAAIRVTAPAEGMQHWLMPTLEAFRVKNGGVLFEIDTSQSQVDLAGGEADIALRLVDRIEDERLIARKIGHARWGVYCSRRHYQTHGAPRSFAEAAGHDIVHYSDEAARQVAPVRRFVARIDPARVILRVGSVAAMVSALRSSGGLGILPCVVGDDTPDLVPCFRDEDMRHTCWIAAGPDAHARPLVRRCMHWIAQEFPRDTL